MFTYGIAETGKRQMKRPSRARVIVARLDGWLMSTQGARVFFSVLTCALTTLTALAITTERANFIETLSAILLVFAILGVIGAMLVSDETNKRANKIWRDIFAREYNAQQNEKRETITRADKAHALEIGKLGEQLLSALRERDELRNELDKTQTALFNLAYALVEDNDIREITAKRLSAISANIREHSRGWVFADEIVRDYASDGIYGYDARLNAKLENGFADWANYNRARD